MHDRVGLERHRPARSRSCAGRECVTPASMCATLIRSRRAAAAAASSTRVLTPSVSPGSSATWTTTLWPCADEVAHGVGQVQLPLDVRRLETVERRPEEITAEDVDRRVRLFDRELLGRRRHPPRRSPRGRRPRRGRSARSFGCRPGRTRGPWRRASRERCVSSSASSRPVVRSGVSPERTSTSSAPVSALSAERTASPVPSGCCCTTVTRPSNAAAVSGETTTTSGSAPSGRAVSTIQSTIRRPEDRVQVLRRRRAHARPAASGHDDGCERGSGFGHGRHVGWGARIRTWDHGTKTRCLTAWPRPSESGRRVYPDVRSSRVCQRRSSSSTARATAASTTTATRARRPTSTTPTGTSTTINWETAPTHVTSRTSGER